MVFFFLQLRRPFILGTLEKRWKATIGHAFTKILLDKGLLRRLYTQNIDGLDYWFHSNDDDRVVPVHGSIGKVSCENCGDAADHSNFVESVRKNIRDIYGQDQTAPQQSSLILCENCNLPLVKPATVLYGRSLPPTFFRKINEDQSSDVDLVLVVGTSLTVSPANLVPTYFDCVRVLVNNEQVGNRIFHFGEGDVFLQGDSDSAFLDLCVRLGWLSELAALRDSLCEASVEAINRALANE
jgi:NAD-dependent deacetylase sirtuin 2